MSQRYRANLIARQYMLFHPAIFTQKKIEKSFVLGHFFG